MCYPGVSNLNFLIPLFLTLLLSITTIAHFISLKYDIVNETKLDSLINDIIQLVAKCEKISNYRTKNLVFSLVALALIFYMDLTFFS